MEPAQAPVAMETAAGEVLVKEKVRVLVVRMKVLYWRKKKLKKSQDRALMGRLAPFPGLLSPNAVEGLVKLLHRKMSGRRWEAWFITLCIH